MFKNFIAKLMSKKITKRQKRIVHRWLMNDFFRVIEENTVDIPEFMKPVEEQHTTIAWEMIEAFIKAGQFDVLYRKALAVR